MGAALTAPWSWGYIPYSNPYYVEPVVIENTTVDYSQPIQLAQPSPAVAEQAQTAGDSLSDQAATLLDLARDTFKSGDYAMALTQVNQAIAKMPNDSVLHEFRALTLFALKRYKESAGTIYAVLSAGPGWDWTTMVSLYPDVETYTEQLRALESYVKEHQDEADTHFLLAYQYLSCGHQDAAASQFRKVVTIKPDDHLASQLLAALSPEPAAEETAATEKPAAPAKPMTKEGLVGSWKTDRSYGPEVKFTLTADGKFTWAFTANGKVQEQKGDYELTDGLLVLKQNGTATMVGQTNATDGGFSFKLVGGGPSDPGLTFGKSG